MKTVWQSFRNNKYYLSRYFTLYLLVVLGLSVAIKTFQAPGVLNINWGHWALLPFAILAGIKIPVLMHNCMHGNVRPRWLNEILGEFSAFFALTSLSILRINHTFHHAHADTSDDPHDPLGKSFITYLFASQLTGARIIEGRFYKYHGYSPCNVLLFKLNGLLHYGSHFARLWLWFLILGPNLFVSFYLPAFIVYSLAFAHVNYITHTRDLLGNVVIINKDDNLYYNLINFIGDGVYYHKNHHQSPKLMNPMTLGKGWNK